ncbi:MAG: tetratricopeptide repeat protein, partial [Gammaproteobacteria bacterium]|nr:tetratricopeptide repeat protein [Gammaproteobacteria bacterium]
MSLLLIAGCSTTPSSAVDVPSPAAAPASAAPPNVPLTAELLYDILLGEIAGQRGYVDVALEALTRAALESADPRLLSRAAGAALRAERFDKALEVATAWIAAEPNNPAPKRLSARALLATGQPDAAYAQLAALIKHAEPDVGATYRRIADLMARTAPDPEMLDLMDRLIALHPDNAEAYYAKAFLADRLKEVAVTGPMIDKALALRPDWEEAALAKFGHLETEQPDDADAFAEAFLEQNPGADVLRTRYARYLVDQEHPDEALVHFKYVADRDPDNADAAFATGLLSIQANKLTQAQRYLERDVETRGNNDQARLYLGQVATELGDYDAAERWYREIEQPAHVFDAQMLIGHVYAKRGNIPQAITHLQSLMPVDDQQKVRLFLNQEQVYRENKRLGDAKTVLDQGLAELPDD